jgi:acyl-homoserine lactone synthase
MMFIVNSENRSLFAADLLQMHRQRKAVFVDGAGWNVPVVDNMEIDRYDLADTTYLLAKESPASEDVLASVRLLPTTRPHLMSDLFVEACRGIPPRGPAIWEASRFCISHHVTNRRARLHLLWQTVSGVIETALLFGLEQVIFVANAALLPLMLNCGWRAAKLGPTLPDGNDQITAVAATISPIALRDVRRRFGIPGPVVRFPIPITRIAA